MPIFFTLAAFSLVQDVFSGVVTHLGAAHTHFEFCYVGFGLIMDTLASIVAWVFKVCFGIIHVFLMKIWIGPRINKEA